MNYRPPITFAWLSTPLSSVRLLLLLGARGCSGGAVAWRKHIHKTGQAKPLYIPRRAPHPPGNGGWRIGERRQVEFISTEQRETAGANHELRPITGIVTIRAS